MARYFVRSVMALTLSTIATPGQQQPGPGEVRLSSISYRPPALYKLTADAKLVEVGVVVRDPRGHAVAGLTKDDFEVADEGKKRPVSAFSAETSAPMPATAVGTVTPPAVASSAPATVSQRYVALLFDDWSMTHAELLPAQAAARRFVKDGLRGGDHAALFTMSGAQNVAFTTDISKLSDAIGNLRLNSRGNGHVECPSMTPYEAYLIANHVSLETFNVKIKEAARCQNKPPVADLTDWSAAAPATARGRGAVAGNPLEVAPGVMSQASAIWEQARVGYRTNLMTIGEVVDLLGRMPGSRTLLFASSGFLSSTLEQEMDEIVRRALRAGVVIDSIDAKGLFTTSLSAEAGAGGRMDARSVRNMQSTALPSKEAANDAAAALAYNTGGLFFHNRNDLDTGFELGIRPEVSYLLAFTPEEAPNGQYHHLKVRLKTPGHNTVQARLGYMALKHSASKPRAERRIDLSAEASTVMEELPGDFATQLMHSAAVEHGVVTIFHVDIGQLRFTEKSGVRQQKLSLIAMLSDAAGNFVTGKEGTVTLALEEPTFQAHAPEGMNFTLTLPAPPGSYQLRAVMGEGSEGRISARTLPVEIQ